MESHNIVSLMPEVWRIAKMLTPVNISRSFEWLLDYVHYSVSVAILVLPRQKCQRYKGFKWWKQRLDLWRVKPRHLDIICFKRSTDPIANQYNKCNHTSLNWCVQIYVCASAMEDRGGEYSRYIRWKSTLLENVFVWWVTEIGTSLCRVVTWSASITEFLDDEDDCTSCYLWIGHSWVIFHIIYWIHVL